jgi:hypothetical protein
MEALGDNRPAGGPGFVGIRFCQVIDILKYILIENKHSSSQIIYFFKTFPQEFFKKILYFSFLATKQLKINWILENMKNFDQQNGFFFRNVTTCCTQKRTRRIKFYSTPVEIVITNKFLTTIAFMSTKLCTKLTN